jgi:hypothetical protein
MLFAYNYVLLRSIGVMLVQTGRTSEPRPAIRAAVNYTRSITIAMPCPTPMHIVHSA